MKYILFFIGILIAFGSCSNASEVQHVSDISEIESQKMTMHMSMEAIEEDAPMSAGLNMTIPAIQGSATLPIDYISSSAAIINPKDSTHKLIRTANLKFRVNDVIRSTYDIEDITVKHDGFVTYTHLASVVSDITTVKISNDSSLMSTHFIVTNNIKLRVPNIKLDAVLKEIARNIDFLDYRTINVEDVTLKIVANDLAQRRIARSESRLINAIDNRGRRLNETTSAEELLLRKQEQADRALIDNLSLADQINFSTVTLYIYQKQSVKQETIANDKTIYDFRPNFGNRMWESIKQGWGTLIDIVIFIAKLWWFILLLALAVWAYKKYGKKIKKQE